MSIMGILKAQEYEKEDVVWYDFQLDNSPQETKMTETLTNIGHRTAFNNEQCQIRMVSYKRPRYDNVKQFKQEN